MFDDGKVLRTLDISAIEQAHKGMGGLDFKQSLGKM